MVVQLATRKHLGVEDIYINRQALGKS